ncbi:ATP-binding cassette domain-containing protein [Hyphomicrobium sp.]|uniref:quaternary amine ABC transporter ATP-binding protein n=1 Tax=Hyphomicrobium sp. TaxID=82 RepID=UPI0025BB733D|nr:ATP-binding cassette domain-containing protein [Hyphomicrobium sp.]
MKLIATWKAALSATIPVAGGPMFALAEGSAGVDSARGRFTDLKAAQSSVPAPQENRPAKTGPILSCRDLWKVYGGDARRVRAILAEGSSRDEKIARLIAEGANPSVAGVSLDVRNGEILMVMGLSGSGKSTMVRCLSRLIEPEAGEVRFEGLDLLQAKPADLTEIRRRKIGMVFQNFGLMGHLTAINNVAFPLRVQGLALADRLAKARSMLELVGLAGREDCFPHLLSGGQQQRVGIARSLITDPDLWFLDEPFSALDPLIRKQMQDEFLRLQAKLHKTIIFVTHDFLEAARLGDRIAIMKDGKIVQIGSVLDFLLNPADDYVRSFVADVPALRVVKAGQIAVPVKEAFTSQGDPVVNAEESIESTLKCFLGGAQRVAVRKADGTITGIIDHNLIKSFLGRTNSGHA